MTSGNPLNYGDVNFWNERYSSDLVEKGKKYTYDWYVPYEKGAWSNTVCCVECCKITVYIVQQMIESFSRPDKSDRVLILGCGTSTMAEKMYQSGFLDITGVDFSHEAIDINIAKYREWPGMDFIVANVMYMDDFEDGRFTIIIDKGCIDAVMCGFNSIEDVNRMNKEVHRVLAPGAQFFSIGYGVAEMRMPHLQRPHLDWDVTVSPVVGSSQHRIYRCEKEDPNSINLEKEHRRAQEKGKTAKRRSRAV